FPGHPACEARHDGLVPPLLVSGREGPLTAPVHQGAHSPEPHGGTAMQAHTLGVGEELVIAGGIRLTVLPVAAAQVLLGLTAPEPSGGGAPPAVGGSPRSAPFQGPRGTRDPGPPPG